MFVDRMWLLRALRLLNPLFLSPISQACDSCSSCLCFLVLCFHISDFMNPSKFVTASSPIRSRARLFSQLLYDV